MDSNHLDQQQPQQQQSQTQQHVGPSQLPDESYIEKLFPKCQPKAAQVRGANQQFRNKRPIRVADRQQHNKRQNRAKLQQQPQQQHQPGTETEMRPTGSSRRGGNAPPMTDKGRAMVPVTSNEVASSQTNCNLDNARQYYNNNSSDSSDKETNINGQNNLGTLKRSSSSQLPFPASNQQREQFSTPHYNSKPRTRKYRASKNLQQQLKRSQSSYSKLFGSQPVPVDIADRDSLSYHDEAQPSNRSQQADTNELKSQAKRSQTNGTLNGRGNLKDPAASRTTEKGNRTNRGIVFAEPVATTNVEADSGPQLASVASKESSPPPPPTTASSNCAGEIAASATTTSAASPVPAPMKARHHAQQHRQASAANKAADSDVSKAHAGEDGALIQAGDGGHLTDIPHPPEYSNPEQRQRRSAADHQTTTNQYNESGACETRAKVDNEDDDRFINLFVYDNTSPRKQENKELDKTPLITFKQQPNSRVVNSNHTTEIRQHDIKASSRQLLGPDLGEDIISNDTSTEELCSFGDNDADVGIKIKPHSHPSKRTPDNDSAQTDKGSGLDIAPATINKSSLKHNRPMSTLQTVDEKAEINIEEENNDGLETATISKAKQVELSESSMIKKSLVPPGFPQRVKPVPVDPNGDNCTKFSPASSIHVPLSPTSSSSDVQSQAKKSEETCCQPSKETSCIQLDDMTEESQTVIERNLSDALNKVSLDMNVLTLRQLKLPNEASHFSAVRSSSTKNQSASTDTPRSSLQFNTLSDGESGADDETGSDLRSGIGSLKLDTAPKRQQDFALPSIMRYASPGSSSRVNDDDVAPATKTALVFPRLDEGLSSEAESCDDEVDDDDDKAMEADVEADDDDDDEDDDEDDDVDNNPTLNVDKNNSSMQANVDSFQHNQSMKPQNRLIGNLQQQTGTGVHSRVPELKSILHSSFGDFNNPEPLDQEDLKPIANYANHNGQSNYWVGVSQQTAMSSQPTSSSRVQPSNSNNGNNANLSRSNNYVNREDVKTANRLSSDTDNETDRLLGSQRNDQLQKMANNELVSNNSNEQQATNNFSAKQGTNSREVLIEGVLFNVKYLGSTHTECEGRGEKEDRIQQAELAVHEVKFRNGETHLPVEVQLFISTEKIMVLDDKHRKIMMDHSLRTISYIADIGDAIVLIVRKKSTSLDNNNDLGRPISKTSCHVFESNESHTITKSISQAFQVAYTELLKANGGGDGSNYLPKELDYQEVLNSQEMSMTELEMFARKDNQREVIVPKKRGEILGLSIVESGWGSVLPTAVIASLKQDGPAYRCKKLSVGDQILSINGISLVGLSLAECQKILRKTKNQSVARLSVVPCPITVEVKIKRPDTKYQLGFSVQHGVICSLLRGGIAERGGVRVGHRIISINGTTVVGVPHDKIVTLLASSVGEIRMKTCLTSLYRHMLGEEKNVSFV